MSYTKEFIIKQLMWRYKMTENHAEILYNAYKDADDLEILIRTIFRSDYYVG